MGPHSISSAALATESQPITAQPSRGAKRKIDEATLAMLTAVLPKLAMYLISEDASVIAATQSCLQNMLQLQGIVQALDFLDKPTKACLAVFRQVWDAVSLAFDIFVVVMVAGSSFLRHNALSFTCTSCA